MCSRPQSVNALAMLHPRHGGDREVNRTSTEDATGKPYGANPDAENRQIRPKPGQQKRLEINPKTTSADRNSFLDDRSIS